MSEKHTTRVWTFFRQDPYSGRTWSPAGLSIVKTDLRTGAQDALPVDDGMEALTCQLKFYGWTRTC
jgi:hypothetical protein